MQKNKKKFIAMVGLGYWGKNILRNLYELGALRSACDFSPETVAARREAYPEAHYTLFFDEILRDPEVEAVAVATPAATHYRLVKEALLAGKDVFVEKPLSLTVREGREVAELAREKGRVLMVGHILQYHPAIDKLKELIGSGELGKIQYIHSNRLNIGKLRTEENILWSFAPHDISVMLALLGEEPARISSQGGAFLNSNIYDTTLTAMEFNNGVKGHIFVSWLYPYKEQKLIVVGSRAMALFDDMSREKLFLYPHKIEWKEGKTPIAQKASRIAVPIDRGEPLKNELLHFIECVRERKPPLTDAEEGLRVLSVLEKAEEALLRGRKTSPRQETPAPPYFTHESACIDPGATVGPGTRIWHFSHVLPDTVIGKNCNIGQNVVIGPDVRVGDSCKIQNNVSLYKGVTLEREVFCGPSCVFTNVYNPRAFIERKKEFLETLVRRGATIGANATVVCGVSLGRYCLIGAGAVVKKDVPDYALMAGVPARQIGWVCKCGLTLKGTAPGKKILCRGGCESEYELNNEGLRPIKELV